MQDGKIFVTANKKQTLKENKSRPPVLTSSDAAPGNGVIIVGGGAGAVHAVESLREVSVVSILPRNATTKFALA